jgi:hypothetical protein
MTNRYDLLMQAMVNRDNTLCILFALSACLVVGYVGIALFPMTWRKAARGVYAVVGVGLMVFTLFISGNGLVE